MMYFRYLFMALALLLFSGCTTEQVTRNLYQGLTQNPVSSDGARTVAPPPREPMTYDQYKLELERAPK